MTTVSSTSSITSPVKLTRTTACVTGAANDSNGPATTYRVHFDEQVVFESDDIEAAKARAREIRDRWIIGTACATALDEGINADIRRYGIAGNADQALQKAIYREAGVSRPRVHGGAFGKPSTLSVRDELRVLRTLLTRLAALDMNRTRAALALIQALDVLPADATSADVATIMNDGEGHAWEDLVSEAGFTYGELLRDNVRTHLRLAVGEWVRMTNGDILDADERYDLGHAAVAEAAAIVRDMLDEDEAA